MSDILHCKPTTWRGQPAYDIMGSALELVVMVTGGHLACMRQLSDHLNPFWQPQWPAAEPSAASRHDTWGRGPENSLLACIVGHSLCIDRFGAGWPGEERPLHGEAGVSPWCWRQDGPDRVVGIVELPLAGLRVERGIRLDGQQVLIDTRVTHDDAAPRPIEWCEHASIGDPFLDGAEIDADVDGVWTAPDPAGPAARWSDSLQAVPPQAALAMPAAAVPAAMGDIVSSRVRCGHWRIRRADLGRQLDYRWAADDWPWLCLWSEHRSRQQAPWNGRERARGMEFSTKPFPEGKPPVERAESWQDRPTSCLVPAGAEGLVKRFSINWS